MTLRALSVDHIVGTTDVAVGSIATEIGCRRDRHSHTACAEPFEQDRNPAAVALGKASQVAEKRQR